MNKENIKVQMIVRNQVVNILRIDDKEYISLNSLYKKSLVQLNKQKLA